jgi:NAD(P)-dependent dehydrogenase (short-subunit alcohol dehydrogenase family)
MDRRVVIITGASSGIGAAVAREAVRKGFAVVLAARRIERIEALAAESRQAGGDALAVTTDVSRLDDQQRLVEETLHTFGRIDILVNNAGKPVRGGFVNATPEALQDQWAVNVTSLATLTRLALPELRRRHGVVVNVGSTISRFAVPGWGNYAPTKIAVAGLTTALRRELAPLGVRVCLVEPGPTVTEFGLLADWPLNAGLPVSMVARAIVRLFDRPRRRIVVPGVAAPFLSLGGVLFALLSPLVDVVFLLRGKLMMRNRSIEDEAPEVEQEVAVTLQ